MRDGENQTLNMSLSRKCFSAVHLPSRPTALLGTVALRIPSATHPEPLYHDLADKEEAGMDVNPESGTATRNG